jgi:hypothetical protein
MIDSYLITQKRNLPERKDKTGRKKKEERKLNYPGMKRESKGNHHCDTISVKNGKDFE